MRAIWIALISLAFVGAYGTAHAQDDDGAGFLERLIEDSLSGDNRDVVIEGFEGALSSTARLTSLTISDANGVWLRVENASLSWTRTALLRGNLNVTDLSAERIEFLRPPDGNRTPTPEDAEAGEFSLPDLPVRIDVQNISTPELFLGPTLVGEATLLTLQGAFFLGDGNASALLVLQNEGRGDRLSLDAGFEADTENLKVKLDLNERSGGVLSRTLNIPDSPDLSLSIDGEAPVDDFTATISLATDGAENLSGQVHLSALPSGDGLAFDARLSGDVRPLVQRDLEPFFGAQSVLTTEGSVAEGVVTLQSIALTTAALSFNADAMIRPDGRPQRIAIDGRISGTDRLRLPSTAENPVFLNSASITAQYDELLNDRWAMDATVDGLAAAGLRIDIASLSGEGQVSLAEPASITGEVSLASVGVSHNSPALADALGSTLAIDMEFTQTQNQPFQIEEILATLDTLTINGNAAISELTSGATISGTLDVSADELSKFSGLAQRPLEGGFQLNAQGSGTLLTGAFDVMAEAKTIDIGIGQERLDPMLQGQSTIKLSALRDETGLTIDTFAAQNDHITAVLSGRINGDLADLSIDASIAELGLVEPTLSGPLSLNTTASWIDGGLLTLNDLKLEGLGADLSGQARFDPSSLDNPIAAQITFNASDLSVLSDLAKRPLAGSVSLTTDGVFSIGERWIDADIALEGDQLSTGIETLDAILVQTVDFDLSARVGQDAPDIRNITLNTGAISAALIGTGPNEPIAIDINLDDLARVAPGFDGPLALTGTARITGDAGDQVDIDLQASGLAGVQAALEGSIFGFGERLDLSVNGTAPAGLVNGFIEPRNLQGALSFDLRADGPPVLSSLAGSLTLRDGRAALPNLSAALEQIDLQAALTNGTATLTASGRSTAGGSIQTNGPITLSPPYNGNLTVDLSNLRLSDPSLFETSLDGQIALIGPLTGGAAIDGAITLGETEIRVTPQAATQGLLPDLQHQGEPSASRITRDRAGLIETERPGPNIPFPLDIQVTAPNRIFVRGQGLDAELAGDLLLGGTTDEVAASGQFELIRGRLDILGRRMTIIEATADMRGALDPWLRIVAETTRNDLIVQFILEGLASDLEVTLQSTPSLPEDEIAAQLLFGKGVNEISPFQAAQLVSALGGFGTGESGPIAQLRQGLNLNELDVSSDGQGQTDVRAGAYLSENLYSEIIVNNEGEEELNLNLDINRNVRLKGSSATDGGSGIGIFFEKDY
ncbi:MAG: translocation/assembly module TamB domain-containing protein [Pseudomonadota bacterium]